MAPGHRRAVVAMVVAVACALTILIRALVGGSQAPADVPSVAGAVRPTTRAPGRDPEAPRAAPAVALGADAAAPAGQRPVATADAGVDSGPRWEDTLDSEGKYAFDLGKMSEDELRAGVRAVAARYPGVSVRAVACIDRPCQAEVEGSNPSELEGFARDLHATYQGHVGGTYTRRGVDDAGAPHFRGNFVLGTYRKDKLRLEGLAP